MENIKEKWMNISIENFNKIIEKFKISEIRSLVNNKGLNVYLHENTLLGKVNDIDFQYSSANVTFNQNVNDHFELEFFKDSDDNIKGLRLVEMHA